LNFPEAGKVLNTLPFKTILACLAVTHIVAFLTEAASCVGAGGVIGTNTTIASAAIVAAFFVLARWCAGAGANTVAAGVLVTGIGAFTNSSFVTSARSTGVGAAAFLKTLIGGAGAGVIASLPINLEFICGGVASAFFITAAILTSGGTANVFDTKA